MATVEAVFAADSAAVADLLHLARTTPSPPDRTTLAMLSIDSLLDQLGLDATARTALYRDGVSNRRASAEEYRHRQQTLRRLLGETVDRQDEPELARILRARRAALGRPAAELERPGTSRSPHRPDRCDLPKRRPPALQPPAGVGAAIRAAGTRTPFAHPRRAGTRALHLRCRRTVSPSDAQSYGCPTDAGRPGETTSSVSTERGPLRKQLPRADMAADGPVSR